MRLSAQLRDPPRLVPLALPDTGPVRAAIKRISERWPDLPSLPAERDREKLLRRFALRMQADDWAGCSLAEAAQALRIACLPEFRTSAYLPALTLLLEETARQKTPLLVSAAMGAYLETWLPGDAVTCALAERLRKAGGQALPRRWHSLADALPALFDADTAHRAVADRMSAAEDPYAALRALGVPDPHGPGLWAAAQGLWLERIAPSLTTAEGVERLLRWLRPEAARAPLPGDRAARAIAALIRAWGARIPPEELVDRITNRLTDLYGDPRLRCEGPWGALDPPLLDRYKRWLAGANLRLFLDVITKAEKRYTPASQAHMWEPRRRFWLDLYERGRILEAWPAFSPGARVVASDMLRQGRLHFGQQNQRQNLSLLLMRIRGAQGDKIVVEGSHNYKVHIFRADAPNAPALYRPLYDCEELRVRPKQKSIVHHIGNWQGDVVWEFDR